MVILGLLAACGGRGPMPNTIEGLQVVAIAATPAHPTPDSPVDLDVWVADGEHRGAEVLVWSCAPVDGECLEARPPGTNGLALSLWTKVSATTPTDPRAPVTVGWPLLAGSADQTLLAVWALACTPGVCPLFDLVAANPEVGSPAWELAVEQLSDPTAWIPDLPAGEVSVAVKLLPVYDPFATGLTTIPTQNQNPTLTHTGGGTPEVDVFAATDPDGDKLVGRAFVTAGGVERSWTTDTSLTVLWQPPASLDAVQDRFVVVEDGRGGTAVWSNLVGDACQAPHVVGLGHDGAPLPVSGLLPVTLDPYLTPTVTLDVDVDDGPSLLVLDVTISDPPTATQIGFTSVVVALDSDGERCPGVARDVVVPLEPRGDLVPWLCGLGGRSVRVRVGLSWVETRSDALPEPFVQEVVLTLPPEIPCIE